MLLAKWWFFISSIYVSPSIFIIMKTAFCLTHLLAAKQPIKKMAFKCGILCVCSCTERRCKNDWSEKCKISNMLETHTFMYKWLRCSVPRHSVPIQHSAVCLGVFFGATVTASGDLQKLHTCISIVTEVQLYHCLPLVFTRTVNFVPLNRAVFERCSQHVFDTSVC